MEALRELIVRVVDPKRQNGMTIYRLLTIKKYLSPGFFSYRSKSSGTRSGKVDRCATRVYFERRITLSIEDTKCNRNELGWRYASTDFAVPYPNTGPVSEENEIESNLDDDEEGRAKFIT